MAFQTFSNMAASKQARIFIRPINEHTFIIATIVTHKAGCQKSDIVGRHLDFKNSEL